MPIPAETHKPLISICIATYNQCNYIEKCITSVINQESEFTWELLIGDDQSTDGTSEKITQITSGLKNITHFRHKVRLGASANMQFLFGRAKGEYIAHLDGDDYWLPQKLQKQIQHLQSHPDHVAVYSNALTCNESGRITGQFNNLQDASIDLDMLLIHGNFLNNSSMILRRQQALEFCEICPPFLDYQGHLQHALKGPLAHMGECLAVYRHNSSTSMVASDNNHVRELYLAGILSVPKDRISVQTRTLALADFMRRVAFRSIRELNFPMLKYWWHRVSPLATEGKFKLLSASADVFIAQAIKQCVYRATNRAKVLYYY
ncbi:glycosyltransferase [Stenotrophomonas sp.]|uniref:glycosyltransferase family 2 protein n=1 Tax=Stenotrophomonas sp. TaxID=69392 RepID=UPI0028AF1F62|nr:glycosyltransferase [Stenotrophomonas sp.]